MRFTRPKKKDQGASEAPAEENIWEEEPPAFNPPRVEEVPEDGVFAPPKAASAAVPRYRPVRRDFFDLNPEEVETWKASRGSLAVRRKRNVKPVLYAAAAACALGLAVTAIVLLWPSSTVKVPGLEGKALYEAMGMARGSSLNPVVSGFEHSDRYADGLVLSQKPPEGTVSRKGSKLKLTVSKGPSRLAGETEQVTGLAPPEAPGRDTGDVPAGPLSSMTVCVDPGGQAKPSVSPGEWVDPGLTRRENPDPGLRGVSTGNPEYLLSMDIAERLKGLLEKDGMRVVMTRSTHDVDLSGAARADIASQAGAALLVSIHMGNDAADPAVRGSSCLYPVRNRWTGQFYESSKAAALFVEAALVKACGTESLGVEPLDDKAIFNWSQVPVIEAQVAFLSNPGDDILLAGEEFRQKAAWGLRDGIVDYLRSP